MEYIAEIGWNFMGDMDLASDMVKDASDAKATTVKFQYWNPDKLKSGDWDHDGRREIYEKAQLNQEKIETLQSICIDNKVDFLISVFNAEDAKVMAELGISSIKIPSHEITNERLHRASIEMFDRIYLSCGACSSEELDAVADIYSSARLGDNLTAMHCISSYPCPSDKVNLPRFRELDKKFSGRLGFSDHSQSAFIPALSIPYGCSVIEKHFTSNKELPGRDNKFALVASEFKEMVQNCETAVLANKYHGIGYLDIEAQTVEDYRGRWG